MKNASLMGPMKCKGYNTLVLRVFHLAVRILCLSTMEVKSECTREIGKFLKLFNRRLSEVSENEGYRFNPKAFHVDEAGANPSGIKEEFGEEVSLCSVYMPVPFKKFSSAESKYR